MTHGCPLQDWGGEVRWHMKTYLSGHWCFASHLRPTHFPSHWCLLAIKGILQIPSQILRVICPGSRVKGDKSPLSHCNPWSGKSWLSHPTCELADQGEGSCQRVSCLPGWRPASRPMLSDGSRVISEQQHTLLLSRHSHLCLCITNSPCYCQCLLH